MANSVPVPPPPAPRIVKDTETTPSAAAPVVNPFKEAIHGVRVMSSDKYSDGVQLIAQLVTPYDVTSNPGTYTMPSSVVPGSAVIKFASAQCTTVAATDLIVPTTGKRWRLLGFGIAPDAGLAAAGTELITLIEETLGTFGISPQLYLPAAALVAHQAPIVMNLPREGYLATAASKKLQITLSAAVTAGSVSITAVYTEE